MQRVRIRELSLRRVQGAVARRRHRWELVSQLPRGGAGAEIGTWEGDFAAQLLKRVKPRRLYLIDPWEHRSEATYERAFFGDRTPGGQAKMDAIHESVCQRFASPIASGQVVVLRARSTEAADLVEPLDWVYIDGDHTYNAVKADLERFYERLKPGGVIAGDDYGMAGWWGDGVTRAVDEFVASHRVPPTFLGNQFLFVRPTDP
jgi:Methyltransferase domain